MMSKEEENNLTVKRLELMLELKESRIKTLERTNIELNATLAALAEVIRKLAEIPSMEYKVAEKKEKAKPKEIEV